MAKPLLFSRPFSLFNLSILADFEFGFILNQSTLDILHHSGGHQVHSHRGPAF